MEALIINDFGSAGVMGLHEVPLPEPGHGAIRVRIRTAGLNPVDWKIREGYLKDVFPHHFPVTLGWDCAGVVDAVGSAVTEFAAGDEVLAYCRKDFVRDGSFAEFIVLGPEHLAQKPPELSFERAGALPLVGLTARQALDAGQIQRGDTVLVHAAAGGVGHIAVQLAKQAGATVIGTSSPANHEFLTSLGVDHPFDYQGKAFVERIRAVVPRGVDLSLDCIGGDALARSADYLAPGGRVVSVVDSDGVESLRQKGLDAKWIFVEPNPEQLATLASSAANGDLHVEVEAVHPLAYYAEAFAALKGGHTRGKLVFRIA